MEIRGHVDITDDPDKALSDGPQSLYPDQFDRLMGELRRLYEPGAPKQTASAGSHLYDVQTGLLNGGAYGVRFAAGVERGVLSATQFHPEKSGDAGAALLQNWVATL